MPTTSGDDDRVARAAAKRAHAEAQNVAEPSAERVLDVLKALSIEVGATRDDLAAHAAQLAVQDERGRTNRRLIWALAGSFAADVLLTVGLGYVYHRVDHNSSAVTVNCRATAQAAKVQKDSFGPFLTDQPDNPATAVDEHAATIRFRAYIDAQAARRC